MPRTRSPYTPQFSYYEDEPNNVYVTQPDGDAKPLAQFATNSAGGVDLVGPDGVTRLLMSEYICSIEGGNSIPTGAATVVDIIGTILDTHSLANLTNDTVANPFYLATADGYGRAALSVVFAENTTGTYRRVSLQQQVAASTFVDIKWKDVPPCATGDTVVDFIFPLMFLPKTGHRGFRIRATHDATATPLDVMLNAEFVFLQ